MSGPVWQIIRELSNSDPRQQYYVSRVGLSTNFHRHQPGVLRKKRSSVFLDSCGVQKCFQVYEIKIDLLSLVGNGGMYAELDLSRAAKKKTNFHRHHPGVQVLSRLM